MDERHCTICDELDARLCQRCFSSAYCSIECQQTDWPTHQLLCRSFRTYIASPGENFRRAILFPTRYRSTRWIWVEIEPNAPRREGHDRPLLDELLKNSPSESGYIGRTTILIRGNALRGDRPNGHTIEVTLRDDLVDMSPINQSTASVGGNAWYSWKGPMIVMAKEGVDFDPAHYIDATLDDFRDVVEYLRWYREGEGSATDGIGRSSHFARQIIKEKRGKVLGVRVNCVRDQMASGVKELEEVLVPRRHPLFYEEGDDPSEVSERVGLTSERHRRYQVDFRRRPVRPVRPDRPNRPNPVT